jgi:Rhodopirellula transposase DDE domain
MQRIVCGRGEGDCARPWRFTKAPSAPVPSCCFWPWPLGLVFWDWTDLTVEEIRDRLMEKDLYVCPDVVRGLLDEEGYGLRQIQKYLDMGQHEDRDAQFLNIARIKGEYLQSGDPVVSIDTKKKELLGTFYRDGKVYTRHQTLLAYDHDFPSHAEGVVIPYGLYDLKRTSVTSAWGRARTPARSPATASPGGGPSSAGSCTPVPGRSVCCATAGAATAPTNTCSRRICRGCRIGWGWRYGWHYPPYCSKYNPIEQRLFCHMTRACQGVLFDSVQTVVRLLQKTSTSTGLRVAVEILDKVGRKYTEGFKENMKILFDDFLPGWNYRAVPQP